MSQKLTLQDIEKITDSRGHKLIKLSHPENPRFNRKGLITFVCSKNHTHTATVHSYLTAKNGCPECKKIKAVIDNTGKKRKPSPSAQEKTERRDAEKQARKARFQASEFCHVNNSATLISHLENNPNPYNILMLTSVKQKRPLTGPGDKHHIIPRHMGGPDSEWNLVKLTAQEHYLAHKLRYEVYKDANDLVGSEALRDSELNSPMARELRARETHEISRKNKTGFFSSETQAANGRKGGAVKSPAKHESYAGMLNPTTKALFVKGSTWTHPEVANPIVVKPGQATITGDLHTIFLAYLPEGKTKDNFVSSQRHCSSAFFKVIMGKRQSYLGFRLIPEE